MTECHTRNNKLRAYRFENPKWVPMVFGVTSHAWYSYDYQELDSLMTNHPFLFPNYKSGSIDPKKLRNRPIATAGPPYTDMWGCVWQTVTEGVTGAVIKHALETWDDFDTYKAPDPDIGNGFEVNNPHWEKIRANIKRLKENNQITNLGLPHGHTFLRLEYIRGFENLIYDMVDEEPRFVKLISMVEDFNLKLLERHASMAPDIIGIPEDLGNQRQLMISPSQFRKFIKPSYQRMCNFVREKSLEVQNEGVLIHMHSDGYIMEIVDDLIDCGINILNLQDRVNGIDNIRKHLKGRVAINLDVDRQNITVNGTPKDIDDHIRECVEKLGSKEGGLALTFEMRPPIPLENAKAIMDAMEKYSYID